MPTAQRADLFTQSLAEPTRRAILEALRLSPQTVNALVEITGRKQPNVSNHLAKMRVQGLVSSHRQGRQVFYELATPYTDLMFRMDEHFGQVTVNTRSGRNSEANPATFPASDSETFDKNGEHSFSAPQSDPHSVSPFVSQTQRAYLASVWSGDEEQTLRLVNELLANRVPMTTIYTEVFQPTLNQIGDLYLRGEVDEAQEHLATATTERMMARVAQFYTPVVKLDRKALFACVEGNWHSVGLRMLADALRIEGWETYFLGASVPATSLLRMAETLSPHLVVFSCAMENQWDETKRLLERLTELRQKTGATWQIIAGGNYLRHHPELLTPFPLVQTADHLESFLEVARGASGVRR